MRDREARPQAFRLALEPKVPISRAPRPTSSVGVVLMESRERPFEMGQAKLNLNRRQAFLAAHPLCAYCGQSATTVDHCPPRSLFRARHWPETYEFPACESCNRAARLDEQALAVLLRIDMTEHKSDQDRSEWEKLVRGVRNNQPQLMREWTSVTLNEKKHKLRKAFGSQGDLLRRRGWGVLNMG